MCEWKTAPLVLLTMTLAAIAMRAIVVIGTAGMWQVHRVVPVIAQWNGLHHVAPVES